MKFIDRVLQAKTPAGEPVVLKIFELAGLIAFTYLTVLFFAHTK